MDGCSAHSLNSASRLQDLARELNVRLYVLPAHSSHIIQPLDRNFFSSLKSRVAKERKKKRDDELSTRSHKVLDLISCHYANNDPRVIRASFLRAGIIRAYTSSLSNLFNYGAGLAHQIRDKNYCPVVIGLSERDLQLEGVKPARVNIDRDLRSPNRSETSRSIANEDENTINREVHHSVPALQERSRQRLSAPAQLDHLPPQEHHPLPPPQEHHSNQPNSSKRRKKRARTEMEAIGLALKQKRRR
jgi:hypothetical protein